MMKRYFFFFCVYSLSRALFGLIEFSNLWMDSREKRACDKILTLQHASRVLFNNNNSTARRNRVRPCTSWTTGIYNAVWIKWWFDSCAWYPSLIRQFRLAVSHTLHHLKSTTAKPVQNEPLMKTLRRNLRQNWILPTAVVERKFAVITRCVLGVRGTLQTLRTIIQILICTNYYTLAVAVHEHYFWFKHSKI